MPGLLPPDCNGLTARDRCQALGTLVLAVRLAEREAAGEVLSPRLRRTLEAGQRWADRLREPERLADVGALVQEVVADAWA